MINTCTVSAKCLAFVLGCRSPRKLARMPQQAGNWWSPSQWTPASVQPVPHLLRPFSCCSFCRTLSSFLHSLPVSTSTPLACWPCPSVCVLNISAWLLQRSAAAIDYVQTILIPKYCEHLTSVEYFCRPFLTPKADYRHYTLLHSLFTLYVRIFIYIYLSIFIHCVLFLRLKQLYSYCCSSTHVDC